MTNENIHDQAFKELIQECFKEFMELFWPEESKQIDFRTIHFLQQEMSTDHGPGKERKKSTNTNPNSTHPIKNPVFKHQCEAHPTTHPQ